MGRRTRFWLIQLVLFLVVFHVGGGWYFASQIESGALAVDHSEDEHDIVITAIDDGSISFALLEGEPDGWDAYERGAVEADAGRVLVGPVTGETNDGERVVTRSILEIEGAAPAVGDTAHYDTWVFSTPEQRGIEVEEVTFPAPIGELGAWLVETEGATRWAIIVHGRAAERREALRILPALSDAGLTSLVIDYRNDEGAPADPSGQYQFGDTEWEDVDAAIDWAVAQGAEDVVLVGLSTGGAISASTYLHRGGRRIAAMVFDAPILDFGSTIDLGAADRDLIPGTGLPIPGSLVATAKLAAGFRWDIDWDTRRWEHWLAELDVPVLLIHGTEDETVPFSSSEEFATAHPDLVTFVPYEGVGHVRAWNEDPMGYEMLVTDWLRDR